MKRIPSLWVSATVAVLSISSLCDAFVPVGHYGNFREVVQTRQRGDSAIWRQGFSPDTNALALNAPFLEVASVGRNILEHGSTTFCSRWKTYTMIPIIAGLVGWFTNYLAVQMIFRPIQWQGIPIWRKQDEPFGLIGWQGIVPAKTKKMSEAMVNATITQLLSMDEMIQRVDPEIVAKILLPQSGAILEPIVRDLTTDLPPWIRSAVLASAKSESGWQQMVCFRFLKTLTQGVQENVDRVLSLQNCVVEQMMADRSLLGKLFQISGKKELAFLTDSGLVFGFLLGIIQLVVALYWDNPWSLSIGGCIVGLATNWLALKWIFEPVNPTKVGPFLLQGLFLRRQAEVSADFSKFFANKVLVSEQLWKSILTDPTTAPRFAALFAKTFANIAREESNGLVNLERDPKPLYSTCKKATGTLSKYLSDLHGYIDEALDIERTLRTRMMAMTSAQFERVLHPIFEEDELTLILAGGGLGFMAGLVQQSIATGSVPIPHVALGKKTKAIITGIMIVSGVVGSVTFRVWDRIGSFKQELFQRVRDPQWTFYAVDLDHDGYLDREEVRQAALSVLGRDSSDVRLEDIFAELDEDNDGFVSLAEFKQWWDRTAEDDGFRRKLVRGLGHEGQQHHRQERFLSRWRTIRTRNGKAVSLRLVWENRRLLMQQYRSFPS